MSDRQSAKHLTHPGFLRNHGMSRRQLLRLGAGAGGLMLVGGGPRRLTSAAAQEQIQGGPIEVGVFYDMKREPGSTTRNRSATR